MSEIMIEVRCVVCDRVAEVAGELDGSYEPMNLLDIKMTKIRGNVVCVEHAKEFAAQWDISNVRLDLNNTQIVYRVITIPVGETLVSIDVTDKVNASGVDVASIRIIASPDHPVACAVKGRKVVDTFFLDVMLASAQTQDVNVTVLVFTQR